MLFKKPLFSAEAPQKEYYTGRSVSIAVLDTGISPVSDFILPKNRILAFLDLVNGKIEPYDDNGHGTHKPYLKSKTFPSYYTFQYIATSLFFLSSEAISIWSTK